ncbi:hypothetical protein [Cohnella cholangitidis]|uniref:Uncharacterized protein n=1 Tax=Cohnella cholangitidis TaxID=2598458 RepID=A0A7G5C3J2_9BACL|nr:hypothetical protein [Cohnella cholangitidis]QMV43776.1 hypothetical protein FPL14_23335 [Cohnella cholangitidis]
MMKVREAQFRRVLDRGGQRFAEVEVSTDHQRDPQMLAYFRAGSDGSYPLVRVIANDANYEVDWFDNSLHSAFEDVMKPLFSSPDHLAADDRDEFAAQILAYTGVSDALERNLKP